MAVVSTPLASTLVVVYQSGTTPAGAPITRQKGLTNVRHDASEQALYDVAQALFSLTLHPVIDVNLSRNFQLSDE
ncbi:DUF1659 domain-containing protein [Desulfitobacterium sp. THU1]|uniref:DUF1659 domain-containing protein n=1 Tax=Desulfitobacterium sp. THU1 TaxID=3138072 RepID=UPI0031203EEA